MVLCFCVRVFKGISEECNATFLDNPIIQQKEKEKIILIIQKNTKN